MKAFIKTWEWMTDSRQKARQYEEQDNTMIISEQDLGIFAITYYSKKTWLC